MQATLLNIPESRRINTPASQLLKGQLMISENLFIRFINGKMQKTKANIRMKRCGGGSTK